jgi:hypothetical protein
MSFLINVDYQPVVDMLNRLGNQFNKPNLRFLKGDVIALALEKATSGRLKYVDAEGYDSIDQQTGLKYELKSTFEMFKGDDIVGRISLANTNKETFAHSFDYLLCIQSNPEHFAIAQLPWAECNANYVHKSGQFNLAKGVKATDWICKNNTTFNNLPLRNLEIRKLLETIL